jgi:peroxiredoxin
LVQLQADLEKIKRANLQLVAISRDSVDELATFSRSKGISYLLLSDPGSKTIGAYGILNKQIPGIPHPGTFLLDKGGVVRAKLFHEGFMKRHSTAELIEAARGIE